MGMPILEGGMWRLAEEGLDPNGFDLTWGGQPLSSESLIVHEARYLWDLGRLSIRVIWGSPLYWGGFHTEGWILLSVG